MSGCGLYWICAFAHLYVLIWHAKGNPEYLNCGEDYQFSPNYSSWATGYIGTMYQFNVCVRSISTSIYWEIALNCNMFMVIHSAPLPGTANGTFIPGDFSDGSQYFTDITSVSTCANTTFGVNTPFGVSSNGSHLTVRTSASKTPCVEVNILVKDCPTSLDREVTIRTLNATYRNNGQFGCLNNGYLFRNNGSELLDNKTTCLKDATWRNQDEVECWIAPIVTLSIYTIDGKLLVPNSAQKVEITNGSTVEVRCKYSQTYPESTSNLFYMDKQFLQEMPLSESLYVSVGVQQQGAKISCQANSALTRIYNESGRSNSLAIEVLFAPETTNFDIVCHWNESASSQCVIGYSSNPYQPQVTLNKQDAIISSDNYRVTTNQNDATQHKFNFEKKATMGDNGSYILTITSSTFPSQPLLIPFDVIVHSNGDEDQTVIIAVSVVGALVIVLIVAASIFCVRRRKQQAKEHNGQGAIIPASNLKTIGVQRPNDIPIYENTPSHNNEITYETDLPTSDMTYEIPLKEEHKYVEIRNRKGSYENTILPFELSSTQT